VRMAGPVHLPAGRQRVQLLCLATQVIRSPHPHVPDAVRARQSAIRLKT
jgi:hypothetical protein